MEVVVVEVVERVRVRRFRHTIGEEDAKGDKHEPLQGGKIWERRDGPTKKISASWKYSIGSVFCFCFHFFIS